MCEMVEIKTEEQIRREVAEEIFSRLYFGDSNILVVGEGQTLQEFNHGGVDILKCKYVKEGLKSFIERFLALKKEYCD